MKVALETFDVWAGLSRNPTWLALSARCHALLAPSEGEAEEYFEEALRHHFAGEADYGRARTELLFGQGIRWSRDGCANRRCSPRNSSRSRRSSPAAPPTVRSRPSCT